MKVLLTLLMFSLPAFGQEFKAADLLKSDLAEGVQIVVHYTEEGKPGYQKISNSYLYSTTRRGDVQQKITDRKDRVFDDALMVTAKMGDNKETIATIKYFPFSRLKRLEYEVVDGKKTAYIFFD